MKEEVPFAWVARLAGWALAGYVRLVAATLRPTGPPMSQDTAVFAIWHESNIAAAVAALRMRTDHRIVSFSTRGFRGVMMNTLLASIGIGSVTLPEEGSAGRAEAGRLSLELARVGREGSTLVVSCDGPFGPYRVAKPGVLLVARESGLPIQPMAIAIGPPWRLNRRWDRHLVPVPFGRLRLDEGTRIVVERHRPLKPLLAQLQAELDRVSALADSRMRRPR